MQPAGIKEKLDEKFNIICTNIPKKEWKYFHNQSIKYFILCIELITEKEKRDDTAEIIMNCLNDVENNFEPDIDYSVYSYQKNFWHCCTSNP
jgi:hypothetical protein